MKRTNRSLFTALLIAAGLATGCAAKLPALKPVDYPVAVHTAAPAATPPAIEKYRLGEAVDLATQICDIAETSAVPSCRAKRFHNMSWIAHGQTVGRAWVQNVLDGHGDSFVITFVCNQGRPETAFDDLGFRGSCRVSKQPDTTPLFQIGTGDAVYEQRHQGRNEAVYFQFGTR
jgi:hypothetical protein